MFQDYKDLLSAFNAHGVRYLIVGGYAVIFHAQPRFTKDIDLFIQADPANGRQSTMLWLDLPHRLMAYVLRSLQTEAISSASGETRAVSIFFPIFQVSISKLPGSGGSRA